MGCFLSTTKPQPNNNNTSSKASPPTTNSLLEEETVVKEVLSETPVLPKSTISRFDGNDPTKKPTPLSPLFPYLRDVKHHQQNDSVFKKPRMVFNPSDDHLSEDGENVSTATEKSGYGYGYDHDDVSKIRLSSPARYRNKQVSGDGLVGKSPGRKSVQSPGRVIPGHGRDGNANGLSCNRRSSDRRSRSPVTRVDGSGSKTGLGRCQSARGMGRSPGRVGSDLSGKVRNMEDGNGKKLPTSNESLENPLVSLECFIFL